MYQMSGCLNTTQQSVCPSVVYRIIVNDFFKEDSHRKQVSVDDVVSMLDILDTAGQEEYSPYNTIHVLCLLNTFLGSMQDQWFRQGQGFLVVYSVVNKKSFAEVAELRKKIERIKDSPQIPMVLVRMRTSQQNGFF